jgi:CDP-glucose 4,6-dehydratase
VDIGHSFWRGRRVFVTGHTGFKGSWLSIWLKSLGADLTGYSNSIPTSPSLFELAGVDADAASVDGDVRDLAALEAALVRAAPEVVFHLAAQPIVRRAFRDPVETYAVNVMGTVNVLEAVRRADGVRVVVVVTSDKCYENQSLERGYREDDPKGGDEPYGNSKGCAELVTAAYRASFFTGAAGGEAAVATARAGNVIGGGDWGEDRLLPDLMRAALARTPASIRNPGAVRPWQHVLNPVGGYLLLAERLWEDASFADAWNFGPDETDARPVSWLVEHVAALWGALEWEVSAEHGPPETAVLKLDSSRARARLGWSPRWTLDESLPTIVEWYKAYGEKRDLRRLTLEQIEAFSA